MIMPRLIIKELNPSSIVMGVFRILRDALKILFGDRNLVHSIAFLVPIPCGILFLSEQLAIQPLIADLITKIYELRGQDPGSPEYEKLLFQVQKDALILLVLFSLFTLASFAVTLFSAAAAIYASVADYLHKHLTIRELILALGRIWKRPTITFLYFQLFNFCWSLLSLASSYFLITMTVDLIARIGILVLLVVFLVFVPTYLIAVWMVGLVISVAEDDCYGLKAFGKARELMEGRKLQGFSISLLFMLFVLPFSLIMGLGMGKSNHDKLTKWAIQFGAVYAMLLVQMFSDVVYTVFYFECKKSDGEKIEMEIGSGYSLVYTKPLLTNASLP